MASMAEKARGTGLLRGYGPLAAMAVAFLLMIALVPSKAPTSATAAAGPTAIASTDVDKWQSGTGVTFCSDAQQPQVPDDPYSPPCFEFAGENGGATAKGVTADQILVAQRSIERGDIMSSVDLFAGRPQIPLPDITRTTEGLVEYFNKNFQFYGRKLALETYSGGSNASEELTGASLDKAKTDATQAADDLGAFADVSASTQPYSSALADKKVIAIGAPYMSDSYFQKRRPFAWSFSPSCSFVSQASSEMTVKVVGKPGAVALHAGPAFQGKPRKIALLHPKNEEYTKCADEGLAELKAKGVEVTRFSYDLSIATFASEGKRLAAELNTGKFTTVACACDPVVPIYLLQEATALSYFPEWNVMGTALTDTDFAGQVYNAKSSDQWSRAYGATALGAPVNFKETTAYRAYKSVRDDEPSKNVETIYRNLYLLAIGVQLAGPELTPENFEKGMFAYSEHNGPSGGWKFGPGKYTPQTTTELLWWDAEGISPTNGEKGTYRIVPGGPYKSGEIPEAEPEVFKK